MLSYYEMQLQAHIVSGEIKFSFVQCFETQTCSLTTLAAIPILVESSDSPLKLFHPNCMLLSITSAAESPGLELLSTLTMARGRYRT